MPRKATKVSARTIRRVDDLLAQAYGERDSKAGDPLDGLIRTILSQNTTDVNSHAAFASLKQRFPTWEEALAADPDDIADAIRHGGLAEIKSARIQEILAQIHRERGELSLDFICELPVEEAEEYLLSFKGVGPKTAAIVLLFDCGMPLFPVDTHVFRVTSRLGWLPEKATPERAHEVLRELVPEELHFQLHLNLVQHGREVCDARNPDCASCPLKRLCRAYKAGQV